jgi:MFS family permease
MLKNSFQSLTITNYKYWFFGTMLSNVGTWTQKITQDWVIISILTNNSALAVGITIALQFGPQVLLSTIAGYIVDRFNLKRILFITQFLQGLFAFTLGLLFFTKYADLMHVQFFALMIGIVSAIDTPARNTFVGQLVTKKYIPNAIGLNSTAQNLAKMVGPGFAGLLVGLVGPGWSFIINGISFMATIVALALIKSKKLYPLPKIKKHKGQFSEGIKYIEKRPDLFVLIIGIFFTSSFAFNFPTYIAKIATNTFHMSSYGYGILNCVVAVGSVCGALISASQKNPAVKRIIFSCIIFGCFLFLSAIMPKWYLYALVGPFFGALGQIIVTNANSYIQLATSEYIRGRVLAIYLAVFFAGMPVGSPIIGWMCDIIGARFAVIFCAFSAIISALWMFYYLKKKYKVKINIQLNKIFKQKGIKKKLKSVYNLNFIQILPFI